MILDKDVDDKDNDIFVYISFGNDTMQEVFIE